MGRLVEGRWTTEWYDTESTGGRFERPETSFRERIATDGSTPFPAEPGRYRLYVSYACPWAHRTLVARALAGLEEAISVSVVDPHMGENGWAFSDGPGCDPDPIFGARYLYEVYRQARPDYTGRVTVPVLLDEKTRTIVSNESSEILRMLGSGVMDAFARHPVDLYPEPLRDGIDEVNAFVSPNVNNGVYRCGFATTQEAYAEAFRDLFGALDTLDARLASRRYLLGERATEADWRLFTTLVRFDAVYVGHFKCNLRRIADYPHLSGYLRELAQWPGVRETIRFDHIKRHYYESHPHINPTGIVPLGPELDLDAPHGRGRL